MKKIPLALPPEEILDNPLLNKGTAFTEQERDQLRLHGHLPYHISTIEEQVTRRYANFKRQPDEISKFIFLSSLQNRNEILFYRLVLEHLQEMVPLIYTPTVGVVSTDYSILYREHRGLYLSYPKKDLMEQIINQFSRSEIDVIVITDGERILGLGDLGVGGMAIPVGKLALYTLFGGIHPSRTLPIHLDVGTNNKQMLEDPLYLGWQNKRITGKEYDDFVDLFIRCIKKRYPSVLLQWEDFAKPHSYTLLNRYRNQLCSFNDDIQGTAAVALAAVMSAVNLFKDRLKNQRIALLGGGSAGIGICNKILKAIMTEEGLSEKEGRELFFVVDIHGLIHTDMKNIDTNQKMFAQDAEKIKKWKVKNSAKISLLEVIENAHPTILIGVSTVGSAFTEEIVTTMAKYVKRPVIFPLSNPTSLSEAHPADLIKWTKGEAIIATGSPFEPVEYQNRVYHIAQCNNVYIFPGVGLGLITTKASFVSDQVFLNAAKVLSQNSPMLKDPYGPLFPTLDNLRACTREIAIAVAETVVKEGHSSISLKENEIEKTIDQTMWYPEYPIYTQQH